MCGLTTPIEIGSAFPVGEGVADVGAVCADRRFQLCHRAGMPAQCRAVLGEVAGMAIQRLGMLLELLGLLLLLTQQQFLVIAGRARLVVDRQ